MHFGKGDMDLMWKCITGRGGLVGDSGGGWRLGCGGFLGQGRVIILLGQLNMEYIG